MSEEFVFRAQTPPAGFVPTPTEAYARRRNSSRPAADLAPSPHPIPVPIPVPTPIPFPAGARVLMWKQDPSVTEIGIRKAFLPGFIVAGPKDARIASGVAVAGSPAIPPVSPNVFGDFIQTPGTAAFDAVHAFSVVRQTLTMYQRALAVGGSAAPLPWAWNTSTNTDPLSVYPHGLPNVMNAFYSRADKALKFGDFLPTTGPAGQVFTCRSFDIVSHETGHAVLDGLKPQWLMSSASPQTGGLHESFGDMTAIFLALSQLDQVEAVIAQTKSNLHDKTFLSDLAEQFGLALGRANGLRNADNDLKLSQVGTEVHAISQVFTGAIYDILADFFSFERNTGLKDDASTLYDVGRYVCSLVLRSIVASPASGATFADVANQMLLKALADGKPVQYRNFIRNRFTVREVVVSPTPLTEDHVAKLELKPHHSDAKGAVQDRSGCCGTMTSAEFLGTGDMIQGEMDELKKALAKAKN